MMIRRSLFLLRDSYRESQQNIAALLLRGGSGGAVGGGAGGGGGDGGDDGGSTTLMSGVHQAELSRQISRFLQSFRDRRQRTEKLNELLEFCRRGQQGQRFDESGLPTDHDPHYFRQVGFVVLKTAMTRHKNEVSVSRKWLKLFPPPQLPIRRQKNAEENDGDDGIDGEEGRSGENGGTERRRRRRQQSTTATDAMTTLLTPQQGSPDGGALMSLHNDENANGSMSIQQDHQQQEGGVGGPSTSSQNVLAVAGNRTWHVQSYGTTGISSAFDHYYLKQTELISSVSELSSVSKALLRRPPITVRILACHQFASIAAHIASTYRALVPLPWFPKPPLPLNNPLFLDSDLHHMNQQQQHQLNLFQKQQQQQSASSHPAYAFQLMPPQSTLHDRDSDGTYHMNQGAGTYTMNSNLARRFLQSLTERRIASFQSPSSILAAVCLDPRPGDRVLDLCAAPGSKTRTLSDIMALRGSVGGGGGQQHHERGGGHGGQHSSPGGGGGVLLLPDVTGLVVANEYDIQRYQSLSATLRGYAPNTLTHRGDATTIFEGMIGGGCGGKGSGASSEMGMGGRRRRRISRGSDNYGGGDVDSADASAASENNNLNLRFDRILADVPCSGEGCFFRSPHMINKWSPGHGFRHHSVQLALLRRAVQLTKPGGRIVYSTCTLNPVENEAVVQHVLLDGTCVVEGGGGDYGSGVDGGADRAGFGGGSSTGSSTSCIPSHVEEQLGGKTTPGLTSWRVDSSACQGASGCPPTAVPALSSPQAMSRLGLRRCRRIMPHKLPMDAFFIAVLRRTDRPAVSAGTFLPTTDGRSLPLVSTNSSSNNKMKSSSTSSSSSSSSHHNNNSLTPSGRQVIHDVWNTFGLPLDLLQRYKFIMQSEEGGNHQNRHISRNSHSNSRRSRSNKSSSSSGGGGSGGSSYTVSVTSFATSTFVAAAAAAAAAAAPNSSSSSTRSRILLQDRDYGFPILECRSRMNCSSNSSRNGDGDIGGGNVDQWSLTDHGAHLLGPSSTRRRLTLPLLAGLRLLQRRRLTNDDAADVMPLFRNEFLPAAGAWGAFAKQSATNAEKWTRNRTQLSHSMTSTDGGFSEDENCLPPAQVHAAWFQDLLRFSHQESKKEVGERGGGAEQGGGEGGCGPILVEVALPSSSSSTSTAAAPSSSFPHGETRSSRSSSSSGSCFVPARIVATAANQGILQSSSSSLKSQQLLLLSVELEMSEILRQDAVQLLTAYRTGAGAGAGGQQAAAAEQGRRAEIDGRSASLAAVIQQPPMTAVRAGGASASNNALLSHHPGDDVIRRGSSGSGLQPSPASSSWGTPSRGVVEAHQLMGDATGNASDRRFWDGNAVLDAGGDCGSGADEESWTGEDAGGRMAPHAHSIASAQLAASLYYGEGVGAGAGGAGTGSRSRSRASGGEEGDVWL